MALPTASDNAFPSILITEGTEPTAPAAGKQRLYIDSTTHKLKRTDSSGTDVTIEGAVTFHGCKVYKAAVQSIPNNSSTAVLFDTEDYDTDTLHSTASNTSRITIPSGLDGKWRFTYHAGFVASNTTGSRIAFLRKNGGTDANNVNGSSIFLVPSATVASMDTGSVEVALVATDYVELFLYQNSGGAINAGAAVGTSPADILTLSAQLIG